MTPSQLATAAERAGPEQQRELLPAMEPLASRYWRHPSQCDHMFVLEYLTASTTTGYCRGCGAAITVIARSSA